MKPALLLALLIASALVALTLGAADTHGFDEVVLHLRLPRVLATMVVGAGLSLSGIGMQALLRNPLADPYILGLASGASLGAIVTHVTLTFVPTPVAAAVGALGAALLVFATARSRGGLLPPTRLILAGVSVAAVLSSLAAFLMQVAPRDAAVRAALYFDAGSFAGIALSSVTMAGVAVVAVLVFARRHAWALDRMLLGTRSAESLGVDTRRLRLVLLLVTTALTGILVALAGPIGFVGLVAPHVARLLTGPGHRALLPLACILGALLVLWADTVGRIAFAPREIPAGLLTAAVGGPFFLYLLARRDYGFGSGE